MSDTKAKHQSLFRWLYFLSSLSGFAKELILVAVNGGNVGDKWCPCLAELTTLAQLELPHFHGVLAGGAQNPLLSDR